MRRRNYISFHFLLLSLVLLTGCSKTNWYENFREKEKSPFGTYILRNEIGNLFDQSDIEYLDRNIYDYISEGYLLEAEPYANYICIKRSAYKLTKQEYEEVLKFAALGNHVFFSLNYFDEDLQKMLEIETKNLDAQVFSIENLRSLQGQLELSNSTFKDTIFSYDRNLRRHYFSKYNSKRTAVLGTQEIDGKTQPNFLKVYHGKGAVYVHTQPIAFTNYYMLKATKVYAENVLSYLPDNTVIWDPMIRSSKYNANKSEDKTSVFKFFWQHEPLQWSLYVAFFGLLLFMIFNARRKQRAIPEITPLKNSTVEFTHTIANLYFKEEDHKNAVAKKIQFFLEKIRTKYFISTNNLNEAFIETLASKSGNDIQKTRYLIRTIISLDKKSECTSEELIRLNILIENFLNPNTHGRNK